jgi:biopolymer transport protein TolQ
LKKRVEGFFFDLPLDSAFWAGVETGMTTSSLAYFQSFMQSDVIGQGMVLILIFGSIMAGSVALYKWKMFADQDKEDQRFKLAFRKEQHPLALCLKSTSFQGSPMYAIYHRACRSVVRLLGMEEADVGQFLKGAPHRNRLTAEELERIRESAEQAMADEVLAMEKDMSVIASTLTIAPFLGLLGTVIGVMGAFNGMAETASPTSSAVISGISTALLTTVVGLVVAIPLVVVYNTLSTRLRHHSVAMDNFVQELIGEFHFTYLQEE